MLQPGTVGEAIMRVKQATSDEAQVALYNLLGDPALPLPVPQQRLELAARWQQPPGWSVTATVQASRFRGHAQIDWLDTTGAVVSHQQHVMTGPRMTLSYTGQPELLADIHAVRVYVWDTKRGQDALGWTALERTQAE